MIAAQEWELWSTTARLVVTDEGLLPDARAVADEVLARVELACSRFRPDSELNQIAGQLPHGVRVSETLRQLMVAALSAARLTEGAVDPTLGCHLTRLGYDRHVAGMETSVRHAGVRIVRSRPGWHEVRLRGDWLSVPEGLGIDLGATAKATAADWVAAQVANRLGCGVLVSLGGDIATAGPGPEGGWQVSVQDLRGDPEGQITLHDGYAVATSSTQKRAWVDSGRALHHILDPATLRPAAPVWRSATVVARACAHANALSTAAIVRGHRAVSLLRGQNAPARLVDAAGRVHCLGGWPVESVDLAG